MRRVLVYVMVCLLTIGCSNKDEQNSKKYNINSIVVGDFFISKQVPIEETKKGLSNFPSYISDYFAKKSNYKVVLNNFPLLNSSFVKSIDENKTLPDSLLKLKQDYVLMGAIESFNISNFSGNKITKNILQTVTKKQVLLESYMSIMLVDLKTKEIVLKENIKFEKVFDEKDVQHVLYSDLLSYMSDIITSKVLLKLAGKVKIIAVQDNQVVLNKGQESGILKEMDFDVIDDKQLNGQDIGLKIADIKITRVENNVSFATLTHIKHLPKAGDFVRLKEDKKPNITSEKIRIMITDAVFYSKNINENLLTKYINFGLSKKMSDNQNFVLINDKNKNRVLLNEQIIDNFSKNKTTQIPFGGFKGADFVIFNVIEYLLFNEEEVQLDFLSSIDVLMAEKKPSNVRLSGHSYIVNVNTGNVIANVETMFALEFQKNLEDVEKLKVIANRYAQDTYSKLVEFLSPTRILKYTNGLLILSNGNNEGILKNDIFNIYGKDEVVKDDYTNISLEVSGVKIGEAKIVDFTKTHHAVAQLISGNYEIGAKVSKKVGDIKKASIDNDVNKQEDKKIKLKSKKSNYLIIKDLMVNDVISKQKRELLKQFGINTKLSSKVNNSKLFKVLSRDKSQIHAIIDEKAIANSKISANDDIESLKLLVADYILIPKIINFKGYTSSRKIEFIESYENKDFLEMALELTLLNMQGEVLYSHTTKEKYSNSWASDSKLKRGFPYSSNVNKLFEKILQKSVDNLVSNKVEIFSQGLMTVVEVGQSTVFLDIADVNIKKEDNVNIYDEPKTKIIKRTGKSVMLYGSKIVTAKVVSVNDGIAEVEIIDGSIKNIKENFIAKKE